MGHGVGRRPRSSSTITEGARNPRSACDIRCCERSPSADDHVEAAPGDGPNMVLRGREVFFGRPELLTDAAPSSRDARRASTAAPTSLLSRTPMAEVATRRRLQS